MSWPHPGALALRGNPNLVTRSPALVVAALMLVGDLVAPMQGIASVQDAPEEPVVVVSGRGSVDVDPDRARIFLAVESEGVTAQQAGQANAALMSAVASAIRAVADEDVLRVSTTGYSLTPRYLPAQADRGPRISGYVARNTLQVVADEVELVGGLIDAGLGAGANRVSNLSFEASNPEPFRAQALEEAVEVARGEAQVMATALGMELGPPLEVQGGAEFPLPIMRGAAEAAMAAQAPTPVEAGQLTVSASVTIRFRLDSVP